MVPSGMANIAKPGASTAGVSPRGPPASSRIDWKASASRTLACQVMPLTCMVVLLRSGIVALDRVSGEFGEQVVEREGLVEVGGVLTRRGPLVERAVPGDLEVVAVGVGEVDGPVRAVVGQLAQGHTGVDEAGDHLGEASLDGEVQRDVMQAGMAALLRLAVLAEPGVE